MKKHPLKILFIVIVMGILAGLLLPASAGDKAAGQGKSQQTSAAPATPDRIRIEADQLKTKGGAGQQAIFSGNVRAIGDTFDLTADTLIVHYSQDTAASGKKAPIRETFEKIIATGNVTIRSGEKVANTDKAVYDKKENIIILTGKNARVRGKNGYISGEKIILHTDNESVTVESSSDKRVEAVINPEATDSGE